MPDADPALTDVMITFFTHNDNKDHDTGLNVTVFNKVNLFLNQVIAQTNDLAHGQEFGDNPPSTHAFHLDLKTPVTLSKLTFPQTKIEIAPVGHDRWIFDFTVQFTFADGQVFSTDSKPVILDQDNRVFNG
jgi:hypothetical protein